MKIPIEHFNGPFNLSYTLNSEQCPADLWKFKSSPFIHLNIGKWIRVKVTQSGRSLEVTPSCPLTRTEKKRLEEKILSLFWADYPLPAFYEEFSSDPYLSPILEAVEGLRVMKCPNLSWSLMEAVNSQNTTVEQVRKRDRLFRKHYGKKIVFDGVPFYTFPKLSTIATLTEEELREKCNVGYRAEYILNAAKTFDEEELKALQDIDSDKARDKLMDVKGIGPKVADICLLYGLGMPDVFPMDVWLKKALRREYFDGETISNQRLRDFALEYFGKHAGFAHLYIFYWERKLKDREDL